MRSTSGLCGAILGVCIGLAAFTGAHGCANQSSPELARMQRQLDEMNVRVEQQTAVLHRALGKYVPIQIPDDVLRALTSIEERLADPARWPTSETEAETLRGELDHLVSKRLPSWAEEELLPRLNSARWAVQALWLLRQRQPGGGEAAQSAEDLRALRAAAPNESRNESKAAIARLKADLSRRQNDLELTAHRHDLAQATAQAEKAVKDRTGLADAVVALAGYDDESSNTLRRELTTLVLNADTIQKLDLLKATLAAAQGLPSESTRLAGLLKVQDAAASLLLDLLAEKPQRGESVQKAREFLGECEAQARALARQQQEAMELKVRAYQKWALGMILRFDGDNGWHYEATLSWVQQHLRAFKTAEADIEWELFNQFPSTRDLIQEKLGVDLSATRGTRLTVGQQRAIYLAAAGGTLNVISWKDNIDQEIAYRVTRDALVQFLLPVSPALLDPPVAQLYQRAFQKGWTRLEGRPEQLHVAEQSAVMKKKGLD
jgi:hypothetical protein